VGHRKGTAQPSRGSGGGGSGAGTPRWLRWVACGGGRTALGGAPARTGAGADSSSRTAGSTAAGWG
jgi:hypothetical protein